MLNRPLGLSPAVAHYNQACETYDQALEAFGASTPSAYEAKLRDAYNCALTSLEFLFRAHLHGAPLGAARVELDGAKFHWLLEKMTRVGRPQLSTTVSHDLEECWKRRNRSTHKAYIPTADELYDLIVRAHGVFALYVTEGTPPLASVGGPPDEHGSKSPPAFSRAPQPRLRQDRDSVLEGSPMGPRGSAAPETAKTQAGAKPTSVEPLRFENDDEGYLAWVELHPQGYVLNTTRPPKSTYLKLHRARCTFVSRLQAGYTTWTNGQYMKVCSESRAALESWARTEGHGNLEATCNCRP